MIQVVWEFRVRPDQREAFEYYYGGAGHWANLFRKSPAYVETILARDVETPLRYLVTDVWENAEAYRNFKGRFQDEYEQLDKTCEQFTLEERCWGVFQIG